MKFYIFSSTYIITPSSLESNTLASIKHAKSIISGIMHIFFEYIYNFLLSNIKYIYKLAKAFNCGGGGNSLFS